MKNHCQMVSVYLGLLGGLLINAAAASSQMVVGCWDFEQSTDQVVADLSGTGNFMYAANWMDLPATLVNANGGKAVRLGEEGLYLGVILKPDSALANLADRFTVALRLQPDQVKQSSVILAYQQQGLGWTIGLNDEGELLVGLRGSGVSQGLKVALPAKAESSFMHVVVVFYRNSGPQAIYLNGQRVEAVPQRDFWGLGDTWGLLIGCRRNGSRTPSQLYHGLLDDLIVLNVAVDDSQAAKLAGELYRDMFRLSPVVIPDEPFFWNMVYTGQQLGQRLKTKISFLGLDIELAHTPAMLEVDAANGLLINKGMTVQKIHAWPRPMQKNDVARGFVAPNGDWLIMFAAGRSQYGYAQPFWHVKTNDMLIYRSTDQGKTWIGPRIAWPSDHTNSFVVPFRPRGSNRLYVFGTEPDPQYRESKEDGPIIYRTSDDNGQTWSRPVRIRPENFPDYTGISGMRMCQTDRGTWLLGSHKGNAFLFQTPDGGVVKSRQYVLRSEDEGATWTLLPTTLLTDDPEPMRRNEGRVINLSDGSVMMLARAAGHLWETRSSDDGLTWTAPVVQPLTHPAAPPMIFHLSDGKTLLQLVHNRYGGSDFHQPDRNELWVSTSSDDGQTWSEPRFLMANLVDNARRPNLSYTDMFIADGQIHFVVSHLWEQVLCVSMTESDLQQLPTAEQLAASLGT